MALPPRAFNSKLAQRVTQAVVSMEARQMKLLKEQFTGSDLLKLFVDPEHHYTLTMAYQLCEPSGHTQELFVKCEVPRELGGGVSHIRFHWYGGDTPNAFYVPYLAGAMPDHGATVRPEASEDLRQRFEQVSQDMIQASFNFATVLRVFRRLNRSQVCRTQAQMRYHWPCIVALMSKAGMDTDHIAEPSTRAGDMVVIPRDVVPLLQFSNNVIARYALTADIPVPEAKLPIEYELRENFKRD